MYEAIFREMAVIRVYSVEELVDVALMLSGMEARDFPNGPAVGIVTFGGGDGVLATDQCAQQGLSTPPLGAAWVERLKQLLVPVASAANPMDLTPQTAFRPEWMARLPEALDVLAVEPEIHTLFFIVGSLASRSEEILDVIFGLWDRRPKTVCVSWPSAPKAVPEHLARKGIYAFLEPARGVRAISRLVRHRADLSRPPQPDRVELPAFDWSTFVREPGPHTAIPEHQCHRILGAGRLPVAAGEVATPPVRPRRLGSPWHSSACHPQ